MAASEMMWDVAAWIVFWINALKDKELSNNAPRFLAHRPVSKRSARC